MKECLGSLSFHLVRSCPPLIPVKTSGEIGEQAVNANYADPVLIFGIRVLVEVEVQE
jgi:hypothetical protein